MPKGNYSEAISSAVAHIGAIPKLEDLGYCISLKFEGTGDRPGTSFLLETRPGGRVIGETDPLQF